MFWLHISVWCFDSFFVWVVSLFAGDRPMSPQFQKVHRPPLLPITNRFECLVSVHLGRFMECTVCFKPPSLLIEKEWTPVMHFCACPIHCKVHWSVGRRLGSCRLISVQSLIRSTIRSFSLSSALWVLEVLCCLY